MAVPVNKEELQNAITTNYNKLKKELEGIPVELTAISNLEGQVKDTTMSINNLVSYLIGWGELVLKWKKWLRGRLLSAGNQPDFTIR